MKTRVTLEALYDTILTRHDAPPEASYVASLMAKGEDAMLRKLAEETTELVLAAKNGDRPGAVHELADLWFHLLVWMSQADITPEDVEQELGRRFGQSGLEEKRTRGQSG